MNEEPDADFVALIAFVSEVHLSARVHRLFIDFEKTFSSRDPHLETEFWHNFWHTILKCIRHVFFCHSIWHAFWHIFWHSFYLVYLRRFFVVKFRQEHFDPELAVDVWRGKRRGTLWSGARGWGPAETTLILSLLLGSGREHCDLANLAHAVEVRRGSLSSWACSSGPTGNTAFQSLQLRSSGVHFDPEVAVRVRRRQLRSRACSWGLAEEGGGGWGGGGGGPVDIKSNNPHLTGAEEHTSIWIFILEHCACFTPYFPCFFSPQHPVVPPGPPKTRTQWRKDRCKEIPRSKRGSRPVVMRSRIIPLGTALVTINGL